VARVTAPTRGRARPTVSLVTAAALVGRHTSERRRVRGRMVGWAVARARGSLISGQGCRSRFGDPLSREAVTVVSGPRLVDVCIHKRRALRVTP
jgi:hypothetical protein